MAGREARKLLADQAFSAASTAAIEHNDLPKSNAGGKGNRTGLSGHDNSAIESCSDGPSQNDAL
ncbi:hypothetical protein A6X20_16840 [Bradyrhizobium elkanii]|nr:hypothetical protein A6452_38925 [Bradyrhizobium elkanii]ODM82786.1 hypothetical protein A6X20_16840 [Bradyrhizobium elkanii]